MRRRFARRAATVAVGVLAIFGLLAAGIIWAISSVAGTDPLGALGIIVALIVVALLARWVLAGFRSATAPVSELIEAAGRVEGGELGIQVSERGPGEVRALGRSFNAMSARLERTEEERRRLLADVSHELRTPLTVIQGNVEAMLDGLYPTDREHLERVRAEAQHLERLIDDLRTISLAEAGALDLEREPIDPAQIAREVAAGFEAAAEAAGVALRVVPADVAPIELDGRRVRQVIANLVSNALRHTPSGGTVTVSLSDATDALTLEVTDTGSGMAPDEVARAFDRFWKADGSPGAGLGLAIVRDLLVAHGGTAQIVSSPGGGTTVTCTFPR